MSSEATSGNATTTIIVARHGERLDYFLRDYKDSNYISMETTTRPWDPPLTNRGRLQGRKLGQYLKQILNDINNGKSGADGDDDDDDTGNKSVAPLGAVYSSPMMRCVQTASEAIIGYTTISNTNTDKSTTNDSSIHTSTSNSSENELKVHIEPGLMESMNEKWYRSWCLPDSNGTWGGRNGATYINGNLPPPIENENDVDHRARLPCEELLSSSKDVQEYLCVLSDTNSDRKNEDKEEGEKEIDDSLSTDDKEKYTIMDNLELTKLIHAPTGASATTTADVVYQEEARYCWDKFETRSQLENRVEETIELLAKKHPNQTVLVLSHGSPCTKLYSRLSGDNNWENHGICTYACFSIYQKKNIISTGASTSSTNNDDGTKSENGNWEALVVNNNTHVKEMENELSKEESTKSK